MIPKIKLLWSCCLTSLIEGELERERRVIIVISEGTINTVRDKE